MAATEKNKEIDLKIESIAFGGSGVARLDGKVVFIPGTIAGETVRVEIISERKNFSIAAAREIIGKSPARIEPVCKFALKTGCGLYCPGCSYQHIAYKEEIASKNAQLSSIISRIAKDNFKLLPPFASPEELYYRNKIVFNCVDGRMGYFMEDNKTLLDIPECHLAMTQINGLIKELRASSRFKNNEMRKADTVTLRYTAHNQSLYWTGKPAANESWLKEDTSIGTFSVPKGGFFQINRGGMDKLISEVGRIIEEKQPDSVIDLYCGAGIFSVAAALKGVNRVSGVDCDEKTIKAASYNAKEHNLSNCVFHAGDAAKAAMREFKKVNASKSLLILDPPRGGLDPKLAENIGLSGIKSIIYISCAPDTLGRDLKIILDRGYSIRSAQMIDMFPRTYHFESLTYLEKD